MKINKNDVFYTKIDGEVYAMRFKAIVVGMGRLNERELRFNGEVNNITENGRYIYIDYTKYNLMRCFHYESNARNLSISTAATSLS